MPELKTRPNDLDVNAFIEAVEPQQKREDALQLMELFSTVTGKEAVMWGSSIIGFGRYHYTNSKGEHSWLLTGFSPRKQNLTLYIMQGFSQFGDDLKKLGKTKHAKSCLYINKLSDINLAELEAFLRKVVTDMQNRYTCD